MQADPTWIIPAAGQVVRNRKEIAKAWDRLLNTFIGKRSQLVVTGMPGTGKTVLLDNLSGKAADPKYEVPGTSAQLERETLRRDGKRLGIAVIPGQDSSNRLQGLNDLFLGKKKVRGVIHVVSFGYTETRDAFAAEELQSRKLQAFRNVRLKEELEDLRATCEAIRSHWTRHRQPIWLLVAANKVDLFSDAQSLKAAHNRYAEASKSSFTRLVGGLQHRLGSDNFEWAAQPVCSWTEDFEWGAETVKSALNSAQRNALMRDLEEAIVARCEAAKGA
jgi:signal recognition particle receptor subunit beta